MKLYAGDRILKKSGIWAVGLLFFLLMLPFLGEPGWADPKTASGFGLWVHFFGALHPLFLHLPIGVIILVLTLEGASVLTRGRIAASSLFPLIFALGAAVLALIFGYCLYLTGSYSGELVEQHKDEGFLFCAVLLLCLLFKLAREQLPAYHKSLHAGYVVSLLATGALLGSAGHHGGLITHGDPIDRLPAKVMEKRAEAAEVLRGDPVVFKHVVQPILEERCVYCHGEQKQEGGYRMDSFSALLEQGDEGVGLVPGDVEKSGIIARMHLPHNNDHHMPPSDKPQPTEEELALIEWWVSQGAPQHRKKSELELSPEVESALANLTSPGERRERDKARKLEEQDERKRVLAVKEDLGPKIAAFNEIYPGALSYISSKEADLRCTTISYLTSFGDADLKKLLPFAEVLRIANFSLSDIDDAAAETVAQLTSLHTLTVSQTGITDAFIESISTLPNLELLNIFGTQVTAASIPHLEKLSSLKTLYVGGAGMDAEQTADLRKALTENREFPVEVVGVDDMPDLELLSEEGIFKHSIRSDPEKYGLSIGPIATLTLSSDTQYTPDRGLAKFIGDEGLDMEFTFHTANEKKPWVQLSFEDSYRITAFLLKNRAPLPQRAEGLVLQRLRRDGSWETIWKASKALVTWLIDLSEVPEDKRESTAFRFMINTEADAMLHFAHLTLWGQKVDVATGPPVAGEETLDRTGQGEWTYVVAPEWGALPGQDHIGSTHGGIVVDQAGRVYVSTDGPNGIIVYRRDGTYLTSIAKGAGRYHGLCIHNEAGQEFIYAADNGHIAKYTLTGQLVVKIEGAKQAEGNTWAKATAVAVAPNGDIFIADGYGSSVIFKYNKAGEFIKKFGARGNQNGQFITSHGIAVDNRNPNKPLLIVCDRENKRLQHFDLDGNFVDVAITGLRRPCAVSMWKEYLLVAELAGRAVLLDKDYKIVSTLGDNPVPEQHANFHVHPDDWAPGVFTAPHGCSFDAQGNLYIQDWNKWGRVTKLLLQKNLRQEDLKRLVERKKQNALTPSAGDAITWKPSQLKGLALWLDADDLSTLTASSGSVSQWDDKSGSGFHAYARPPIQGPQVGTMRMNGKNVLGLHNSRLASTVPKQGDWRDVFVVGVWSGGAKFTNYNGLLTGFGGSLGVIGNSREDGTGLYIPETWWKTLRLNGQAHDGAKAMALLAKPFMATISTDIATDVKGFSIGSDRQFVSPSNQRFWEGAIGEIIGFNRNLTDAERLHVEGYLAHKWGLLTRLPDDHPYKSKQP